jgi:hypothetical protein
VLDGQLTFLNACLTNEVMSSTGIKQGGNRTSIQRKHTCEDLLALENVHHGGVVDVTGLHNGHLLWTAWRMSDVALSGILLQRGALPIEVARVTTVEVGVAGGSSSGRWCRQVKHRWRCR